MIRLITFSDDKMTGSAKLCLESAAQNGTDELDAFVPNDIYGSFYEDNKTILDSERGCGYWLWKPYFINEAIKDMQDGDILIYSDAGVKWIANVNEIISRMDQDIFLFSNGHQHVHWCKSDVWQTILKDAFGTDEEARFAYWANRQQVQASVIFFRVNQTTRDFVKEWLLWCQMPGFIDDSPSKLPNHPEFAEHRHDQALLTCLAIKYGYRLHFWPDAKWYSTQRHRWPDDQYPLMLEHHRLRDKGKGEGKNPEWE